MQRPPRAKMHTKFSLIYKRRAQVFDDMQARGVEADVVTCCSLISALERGGQWQLAEVRVAPAAACTLLVHKGEGRQASAWSGLHACRGSRKAD